MKEKSQLVVAQEDTLGGALLLSEREKNVEGDLLGT